MWRYENDIGFAKACSNRPISQETLRAVRQAYAANKKFFQGDLKGFSVFICNNEPEFRKYAKPYYSPRVTAVALGRRGIATRSADFMGKTGAWTKKDFRSIMTHEMNHVFWHHFCGTWSPNWLVEGMACYVAGHFFYDSEKNKTMISRHHGDLSAMLDFRYLKRNFEGANMMVRYALWSEFVKHIAGAHAQKALLRFVHLFATRPTKANYERSFKKVFHQSPRSLFRSFLRQHGLEATIG